MALGFGLATMVPHSPTTPSAQAAPCPGRGNPTLLHTLAALLDGGSSTGSSTGTIPMPWRNALPAQLPHVRGTTTAMYQLTGPDSPQMTDRNWGLAGTDLGIMWPAGGGKINVAFGDSFDCAGGDNGWTSNLLLTSHDHDPSDGIVLDAPRGGAALREIIPSIYKQDGQEMTVIPTAGVMANGKQYIDFMSVRHWGVPGEWETNYSATVESSDDGRTFQLLPETIRANRSHADIKVAGRNVSIPAYRPGNENFQVTSYVKSDGFIYQFGTPQGRSGAARLARTPEAQFPDPGAQEFWNGHAWVKDQTAAAVVIDAPVAELSVQFNPHLGKFVAMYLDRSGIVLRTADSLEGPWSPAKTVVSMLQVPGIYGGFMYPSTDPNDRFLYFITSEWGPYQPTVMRTDLDALLR